MLTLNPTNIDLGKLADELHRYENQWIAVSAENTVAASGATYTDTLNNTPPGKEVILFKVPPLDGVLAS